MVMPLGAHVAEMRNLVNADVNVTMYREFGRGLCEVLAKPYLQAPMGIDCTTQVPAQAGRADGSGPRAVHREREAFDAQADLGSVALGHAGFLLDVQLRDRGDRNLRPRHPQLPGNRDGDALRLRRRPDPRQEDRQRQGPRHGARKAPADPDGVDQREDVPGRNEERLRPGAARSCPPVSPAPRSAGIPARPSWATPARPICSRKSATDCSTRCSTSCRWARDMDAADATPTPLRRDFPWDADAQARLDEIVATHPVLTRISAAKIPARRRRKSRARRRGRDGRPCDDPSAATQDRRRQDMTDFTTDHMDFTPATQQPRGPPGPRAPAGILRLFRPDLPRDAAADLPDLGLVDAAPDGTPRARSAAHRLGAGTDHHAADLQRVITISQSLRGGGTGWGMSPRHTRSRGSRGVSSSFQEKKQWLINPTCPSRV